MKEEEQLQIMVCNWVKTNTDLPFIHIANERHCNPTRGKILKQMGVMPGVFDIFIPKEIKFKCVRSDIYGKCCAGSASYCSCDKVEYYGLFLELKSGKGKLSNSQIEFQKRVIEEKYKTEVAYGFEEAIEIIKECYRS